MGACTGTPEKSVNTGIQVKKLLFFIIFDDIMSFYYERESPFPLQGKHLIIYLIYNVFLDIFTRRLNCAILLYNSSNLRYVNREGTLY